MKDTPMKNIRPTTNPLNINLPDGTIVKSTHMCNLEIPGLPHVLEGHIVPELTVASLVGIQILCKLRCTVVFTDTACYVFNQGKLISTGYKDPSTDLWMLPITPDAINKAKLRTFQGHDMVSVQLRAGPCMARAPQFPTITTPQDKEEDVAMFTHSVRTRANAIKFAHQSMCNPKISSLMKALQKGYLKGCPNLSEELVTKYFNPALQRPKDI